MHPPMMQSSPYRAQFNTGSQPSHSHPTQPQQYHKYQKSATSFYVFQPRPPLPPIYQATEFDGKRLRKAIARKTVDYNSSVTKMLESRLWQRDYRDRYDLHPDIGYYTEMVPPLLMLDNPINCVTTKFVRTSTNKMRCPIFCVLWTPEGRRLVTGASSGEFTLWNGLTFNFETILQAHDSAVRVMVWSRNDSWMVTADQSGYVKYWQSNMNNVKMFQAHKEPVRAISFCPTDSKFATCSDDGTIRIWDFLRCFEERILRGHGADVKGVDWHPHKSLIASGSKDSQQPVKLWDPKTGQSLATLHAHKNTVTDIKWNQNGNWLLTSSRDHLVKIFDIRKMNTEMQTFRGHKKEASCLAWHPIHENLFASGGSDGCILFWLVGTEKEVGGMEQAHDSIVWSLNWHPLGHILTSGSNDHTCKFWTRNRPGDKMRDKYNLNLIPKGSEEAEYEDVVTAPSIPGMGFGDQSYEEEDEEIPQEPSIPGLGFVSEEVKEQQRKVPFAKPIPKQFQQQWNADKRMSPSLLPPPNNGGINGNASMPVPINETPPQGLLGQAPPGRPSSGLSHSGAPSLLGPPPRFGHRGFIPPLQGMNLPPHAGLSMRPYMMSNRMPHPNMMMPHQSSHQIQHHNAHPENHKMHHQNKHSHSLEMSSINSRMNDSDERFPPPVRFDEDLRHSRDYSERPFERQTYDRRYNDRQYDDRDEKMYDDRRHNDWRRNDRREDPEDNWRPREDVEIPLRPNAFGVDTDLRNRKRVWNDGPGDNDNEEHSRLEQNERAWNR